MPSSDSNTLSAAIIAHVYYPGSWKIIQEKCGKVFASSETVIVSSCYDEVIQEMGTDPSMVLKVPNLGKDIGGKLASLKYYLEYCRKSDLLVFIHDKISPQSLNSAYWFDNLFSIFGKDKWNETKGLFEKDSRVGMVGSKKFLQNEYDRASKRFNSTNNDLLHQQIEKYGIKTSKYDFIAGSIFIVRSKIFEEFFGRIDPLSVRAEMEPGNVLDLQAGTITHSWERLFAFVIESAGYTVKGV